MNKLNSISKKLILGFLFLSLITVIIAGTGILSLLTLKNAIVSTDSAMDSMPAITDQLTNLSEMQSVSRDAVINFHNMDVFESDKQKFQTYINRYSSGQDKLIAVETDAAGKTNW